MRALLSRYTFKFCVGIVPSPKVVVDNNVSTATKPLRRPPISGWREDIAVPPLVTKGEGEISERITEDRMQI